MDNATLGKLQNDEIVKLVVSSMRTNDPPPNKNWLTPLNNLKKTPGYTSDTREGQILDMLIEWLKQA